jgi:hypothetical protein
MSSVRTCARHRRADPRGRMLALLLGMSGSTAAVEPALFATIEDGNAGVLMPTPALALPAPAQMLFGLPAGAIPHAVAFRGGHEALFGDFQAPLLYRALLATPATVEAISLTGRSSGNGTVAVAPGGRYALSIGESAGGQGEAVVVDFAGGAPLVAPIVPALRVLRFVSAAIDFAPDGRAFVCHTAGVSVLRPPYTSVEFTLPFPAVVQSPSMCRLTRDGARLFVTRVLSETAPSVNAVRTTAAPYSAASVFVEMPAPAGVQGLGPMAVSPDGQALLVGQQFLFPPQNAGVRARAFLLRAPFGAQTAYQEIMLPPSVTGVNCLDAGVLRDCPGFEHIELSDDGTLAILTGNSSSVLPGGDQTPAVFIRDPFADATRSASAVQIAPGAALPGRGAGGVRFQPMKVFADGLE